MYDCLIIGAGAAGLSCALVLGSAKEKEFARNKKIALIAHQRTSHLHSAKFYNVLGLDPGTTGETVLKHGISQLSEYYPHVELLEKEKVFEVSENNNYFDVITNKSRYQSKIVVVAVGYTNLFKIQGLMQYVAPHPRAKAEKNRIWLKNTDHLVRKNLYVAGTLAGWRSQFSMAAGSGSHVATDILTHWNNGIQVKVHDKI